MFFKYLTNKQYSPCFFFKYQQRNHSTCTLSNVQCMPCPQIIPFATKSFLKESIKLSGPAIAIYTELCQKVTRVAIRAIADWEKVHQKGIVGTS